MASRYPSQTFEAFEHPQWPIDTRPTFSEDGDSSILDDKILDSNQPADPAHMDGPDMSLIKSEEEYSTRMWPERPHGVMHTMRHYSHPVVPTINTQQPFMQSYAMPYQPQGWPMSTSGTSTPTQIFGQSHYAPSHPFTFQHGGPVAFPPVQHHQLPDSAISMSPQSSQGGWGSSDSTEQADHSLRSPSYCAVSPSTAVRPDGVRKKNARFEIPKDRNLQNIDSLIMCEKEDTYRTS